MEELKFPVGRFQMPAVQSEAQIKAGIEEAEQLAEKVNALVAGLTAAEYEWPYRPGGWNIRQVIHHLSDSHMNAFIRFKLALTEQNPTIKPYDEDAFVRLEDNSYEMIPSALAILSGIHQKWVTLMKSMTAEDFEKTYYHPESAKVWKLSNVLALYVWHGKHHLAHIEQALKFKGSF